MYIWNTLRAGHIVTTGYKLPRGGWFDRLQVSSPQFLAEVLVHVGIGLALGSPLSRPSAFTWWLLTGYVVANHVQLAYDKQLLYRAKFEDMPKDRKMLIPYVL
jgi:3-oxo-5-alpha-steroid 4-dehydrogenase